MRTLELTAAPGQRAERLDMYIVHHVENATRTKTQTAIEEGLVAVNGKRVKASYQVKPNDHIVITITTPAPPALTAENIPLDIIYEDDALLVVNKPAMMVVHPAYGNWSGTLMNALLHHCAGNITGGDPLRPGIVHRLDKGTSGLLLVAKTSPVHAALARQFSRHTIERTYQALVWGTFDEEEGTIATQIARSTRDRKKFAVTKKTNIGKHAITHYQVVKEFEFLSLVELKLETGRTHQIRVHLQHIGHPVFGDDVYGGRTIGAFTSRSSTFDAHVKNLFTIIDRQALHAKTLGFVHPVTKKKLLFDSQLPEDMKKVIKKL